jgi:hypothetical protein
VADGFRIPPRVLEQARRLALDAADGDTLPRTAAQQRRTKDKVVAALRRLKAVDGKKPHPMD